MIDCVSLFMLQMRRVVVGSCLGIFLLLSGEATIIEDSSCKGDIWACPSSCHRAEVVSITAGCSKPSPQAYCLYVYVTYAFRKQPHCQGEVCGNTREAPIKIVSSGNCAAISGGYECTEGGWVRDGESDSIGAQILLPSECGQSVIVVFGHSITRRALMIRIIASHAVLLWTMFCLHQFAIGQMMMAQSPYSGVFILPPKLEPNLTAIEKLLSDRDKQALQGWARTNHYLNVALGDRQFAFFSTRRLLNPIEQAGRHCSTFLAQTIHSYSLLLTPNNDSRGASLLKVLSRPSPRAVFPNLAEIATEHDVVIQRYLQCVAEVQLDNQTLRIVLDEPSRPFDWDAFPKTPSERPMAQERCDSETHADWRVVALGPLVDDKERARLTARAFDRLAEEFGNEQILIDQLLQNWMETLAGEFPDIRPLSWQV